MNDYDYEYSKGKEFAYADCAKSVHSWLIESKLPLTRKRVKRLAREFNRRCLEARAETATAE